MEIKEVWTEFKDRITSPFFGSFVLSWMVMNWRVPVVLIFYKQAELISTKTTFIDVIQRYTGWCISLVFPVISAFIYTFGYPYFKRWVNTYTAKQTLQTDEALLKIGDNASVPVSKFMSTRAELKQKEIALAGLLLDEGTIKSENAALTLKVVDLEQNIQDLNITHVAHLTTIKEAEKDRITALTKQNDDRIDKVIADEVSKYRILKDEFDKTVVEKDKTITIQREYLNKKVAALELSEDHVIGLQNELDDLKSSIAAIHEENENMARRLLDADNALEKYKIENDDTLAGEIDFMRIMLGVITDFKHRDNYDPKSYATTLDKVEQQILKRLHTTGIDLG